MLIYNTTFHVEDSVLESFIEFMKQTYIPQALNSGFFHEACFAKIHSQHENSGCSYSLQLKVRNNDILEHWLASEGKILQQQLVKQFGSQVAGFVTLLQEIDLQ